MIPGCSLVRLGAEVTHYGYAAARSHSGPDIHDRRRFPSDGQRYELLDGFLLVTPAPGTAHQVVLSRLMALLLGYLPEGAPARVTSPGEIEIAPKLLLDPDILVWPSTYRPGTPW